MLENKTCYQTGRVSTRDFTVIGGLPVVADYDFYLTLEGILSAKKLLLFHAIKIEVSLHFC